MIVFRSIAVPLKATLGYLLSVGAALGAVVMVFEWGWADSLFPGISDGPVVSFLPIFVMGVLFGLAMDYEMFLVSAMREHFVTSGNAQESVREGFRASSRVVTAAALIMTSVFVAFIPAGTSTIKQIALGLSVGVFVDAFVVRMTLVPAVLVDPRPPRLVVAALAGTSAAVRRRRGRGPAPADRVRGLVRRARAGDAARARPRGRGGRPARWRWSPGPSSVTRVRPRATRWRSVGC